MSMEIKLTAEERREAIAESLRDWERPCGECEHYKGGCTKWDCVKENERIEEAEARAIQAREVKSA